MVLRYLFIFLCFYILSTLAKKKRNLSCVDEADGSSKNDETVTKLVSFDDYECKNNRTGEYNYEIDLLDGSKHKEEGVVEDGRFLIRGFFVSNADADFVHFYTMDKNGFKYYKEIAGSDVDEFENDDDDDYGRNGGGSGDVEHIPINYLVSLLGG